jgi:PHD/YefM family antitoxin component YafN of YafNO toxin-antitoxin module
MLPPLLVTRQTAHSEVLMSGNGYEGLTETIHLLKSPDNTTRLLRSNDADQGN